MDAMASMLKDSLYDQKVTTTTVNTASARCDVVFGLVMADQRQDSSQYLRASLLISESYHVVQAIPTCNISD
jgi:hypothetical protein